MIARVLTYAFAQARTKAMGSRLLSQEDWRLLLGMQTLENVLRYLRGTHYAVALSQLPRGEADPETASLALYGEIFEDYAKLLKALSSSGAQMLRSLLLRHEAENVKMILRGVWHGRPVSEIQRLLFDMGRLSRLPVSTLLRAREVAAVIEGVRPSVLYRPLRNALPQFHAQGRLFPLEAALDIAVFENIAGAARTLRGLDHKTATALVGDLVDGLNLRWLVRFRYLYDLSPEESINYTLHGGRTLSTATLGALARSPGLSTFLAALPKPFATALAAAETWQDVEILMERWFLGRLYRVFRGDPFQVALQIAYLMLKESEVQSLERLMTAAARGEPQEVLQRFVGRPLRGSHRVQV